MDVVNKDSLIRNLFRYLDCGKNTYNVSQQLTRWTHLYTVTCPFRARPTGHSLYWSHGDVLFCFVVIIQPPFYFYTNFINLKTLRKKIIKKIVCFSNVAIIIIFFFHFKLEFNYYCCHISYITVMIFRFLKWTKVVSWGMTLAMSCCSGTLTTSWAVSCNKDQIH